MKAIGQMVYNLPHLLSLYTHTLFPLNLLMYLHRAI